MASRLGHSAKIWWMLFMARTIIGKMPTGQSGKMPIAGTHISEQKSQPRDGKAIRVQSFNDQDVGERLQSLRLTLGLNKSEMADANGIDRTNYGRFELGARTLPLEIGYRLAERYGVTMDWLYRGRWDGLSVTTAERLRQAR